MWVLLRVRWTVGAGPSGVRCRAKSVSFWCGGRAGMLPLLLHQGNCPYAASPSPPLDPLQGKGPAAVAVRDMVLRMRKENPGLIPPVASPQGLPGVCVCVC